MWNTLCRLFVVLHAISGVTLIDLSKEDCKHVTNAVWNNVTNTCDCLPDHVLSGDLTRCLPEVVAGYDTKCEDDVQCSARMGPGAGCVQQQCVCKTGYHFLLGICHRSVGYAEECSGRYGECYGGYSFESMVCYDGLCRCAAHYYKRGSGECWWNATEIGDDCLSDMDCAFVGGFCNMTSLEQWTCDRLGTLPEITKSTGESAVGRIGSKCSRSEDTCDKNEMCLLGKCVCQLGYFAFNGTCMPELGTACDESNCTHIENAKCRTGKCSCIAPYVIGDDNRECRIGRRIGKQCQLDAQCRLSGGWAACINSNCACKAGSHFEEEEELCWPSKDLGQACTDNKDCSVGIGTAVCNNKERICMCMGEFLPSENNCIKAVQALEDVCAQSADCLQAINNSVCKDNKCHCAPGFFPDPESNKTCLVGLEGPCEGDSNCSAVTWAACVARKCQCMNSSVPNKAKDRCLKVTDQIGGPCLENQQCYMLGENAECGGPDVGCACVEGYYFRSGLCREKRFLGEECSDNAQCFLTSGRLDHVYCLNSVCQCGYDDLQTPDMDCIRNNDGTRSGASPGVIVILAVVRVLAAAL